MDIKSCHLFPKGFFSPKNTKKVIDGDVNYLEDSFSWGVTPHGFNYWRERSMWDHPLSEEDKQYLLGLLSYKEDEG